METITKEITFNYYGKHVGISFEMNGYQQNILFNDYNGYVDSSCSCGDCLHGGNALCKHVVATLLYAKRRGFPNEIYDYVSRLVELNFQNGKNEEENKK